MYLHQGKHKLIEGTVIGTCSGNTRLVLKTQVTLPPQTIGIVPVRATEPKLVWSNQYYQSEPDPHFQAQCPVVATIPRMHCTDGKSQDKLVTCLVNPSAWEVVLPKNKTIQINKIILEHNHEGIYSLIK